MDKLGDKYLGPFVERFTLKPFCFTFFFSKLSNFSKAYLPQFLRYGGVLGLFRNLEESSNQCFWSHIEIIFHTPCVLFLNKAVFLLTFEEDPCCFGPYLSNEAFLDLVCERQICRELNFLQDELWMEKF